MSIITKIFLFPRVPGCVSALYLLMRKKKGKTKRGWIYISSPIKQIIHNNLIFAVGEFDFADCYNSVAAFD